MDKKLIGGDFMNEVGTRLRALRESVRLTQAEIAKLCGSNQTTIGKTEAGKTAPTVNQRQSRLKIGS